MSRKLIVNDGKRERELLLVGTMVVGRDPTCDITESDLLLSRRHVEFVAGARDVVVRDLGSRNGILINGVKTTQAILRGGDVVQVGHLQVTFVDDGAVYVPAVDAEADAVAMAIPPARAVESPTVAMSPAAAEAPTVRTGVGPAPARAVAADEFEKTMPTARKPEVVENPDKTHVVAPPAPPDQSKPPAPPAPAPAASKPPAGADEDSDKTRFVPPPAPTPAPVQAPSAPVAAAPPPNAATPAVTVSAQAPAAPAANEFARTPKLDVQLFLGPLNRIRFEFPKKDWQLVSGGAVVIVSLAQRTGQAAVVVEHTKLNTALAPEDITDLFAQIEADTVREQQPAAADVQARLIAIDQRRLVITTYSRLGVAGPERVRQYSIPVGSDVYRLICSAATPQFADYEPVFAHVAATFATGTH